MFTKKQIQFAVIFFTLFIDMVGFGIIIPNLPRYAEHFGATSFQIGVIVGIYSFAQFAMLPLWGKLSDRIGRRPVLLMSVFGTAVGYLVMGFSRTVSWMIFSRIIDGGSGGNMGVVQAYISDITTPDERSKAMGLLGAAYGFGFIVGPAIGGFAAYRYGVAAPMFLVSGISALNFVLVVFFLPESLHHKKIEEIAIVGSSLWKHVNKKIYIPVLCSFFFFTAGFGMLSTLFALFVYHRYQLNEQQTGWIYTMVGVIAIVIEGWLFAALAKKWSNERLAKIGPCLIAIGFFLLPFTAHLTSVIFLSAMIAIGDSLLTPALSVLTSHAAKSEWQGAAFGFYQSVGSLGRLTGPLIAGYFLAIDFSAPLQAYARTAFFVGAGLFIISFFCSLKIPRKS